MSDTNQTMDYEMMSEICKRFSGKDIDGNGRSIISYQTFAIEDEENSNDKQTIYSISKASCQLGFSKAHPGYIYFDIIFNSYDDTELKLLWGRLQRMRKNEVANPDKTYIFHIHLLEKLSVDVDSDENDELLIGHILNPLMFFLSRETPTILAEDKTVNGEVMGGNVIKMLIPADLFSVEISEAYNTPELKGEARREEFATEYIDNYEAPIDKDGKIWE